MTYKIGIIAPYRELAILARDIVHDKSDVFYIAEGRFSEAVDRAREFEQTGVDVIISRGATALTIKKGVELPVVDLQSGGIDLIRAIVSAVQYGRKILVTTHRSGLINKRLFEELLGIEIILFHLLEEANLQGFRQLIVGLNIDVVVGGVATYEEALQAGIKAVRVDCSKETLERGIEQARLAAEVRKRQKQGVARVWAISKGIQEGIIAINTKNEITLTNPAAEKIFPNLKHAQGKHLKEVLPDGELQKAMLNYKKDVILDKVAGKDIVANVGPIKYRDRKLGSVAIINDFSVFCASEHKIREDLAKRGLVAKASLEDIIGSGPIIESIKRHAYRFAKTDLPVLIYGETGTGKEMMAQGIHNASNRRNGPFVALNCGGLVGTLLESELFGYEEGAFTDAQKGGKLGLFEVAHGGTLFLDEITEIPLELQPRLLRVLEEKVVRPLGGNRMIPVDVRVIAATNRDLKKEVQGGRFREDLYFRLNVLELILPPLRERQNDIPVLVNYFLKHYADETGIKLKISYSALNLLCRYHWPGNIRQLRNVMDRLFMLNDRNEITEESVKEALEEEPDRNLLTTGLDIKYGGTLRDMETIVIKNFLQKFNGNKSKTARTLGISRGHLLRRIKQGI